jgi:hypothetical protein
MVGQNRGDKRQASWWDRVEVVSIGSLARLSRGVEGRAPGWTEYSRGGESTGFLVGYSRGGVVWAL